MKRLRDAPSTTGRPSAATRSRWRSSRRLCSSVLPKPMPGSSSTCSSRTPAATAAARRSLEEGDHLADDVVVAGVVLHRAGLAQHVHETHRAAALGDEARAMAGSPRSAVTSLTRPAPASRAARATTALVVSTRSAPASRRRGARSPARRGRARRRPTPARSPAGSTRRPCRGWPLPRRRASRPWATADSVSACRPPSENESGVTLTMPMTQGRAHRQVCGREAQAAAAAGPP